ncbi:MAG: putative stress-responsive transcriptional regulator [Blastococcus sp.]|jgi:phage shock protein C|nr:putative stress-responsive transcriptional regulator [Blastococcus sp.]
MTNAMPSTPSDQPNGDQPPRSVQPPLRPELRRSGSDRLAGGVCGGLAEYSGIDSLLWRVGFVGLTVAGGAGILVYLLLWVLMPPASATPDEPVSALEQLARRLHDAVSGSRFSSPGR